MARAESPGSLPCRLVQQPLFSLLFPNCGYCRQSSSQACYEWLAVSFGDHNHEADEYLDVV